MGPRSLGESNTRLDLGGRTLETRQIEINLLDASSEIPIPDLRGKGIHLIKTRSFYGLTNLFKVEIKSWVVSAAVSTARLIKNISIFPSRLE